MNEFQQRQIITDIVTKAIETGKIKMDFPQAQPPMYPIQQFPIQKKQEEKPKTPTYQGIGLSIFDVLTCIMFALNLIGITEINWLLVFLPFAFPYIVFYGAIGCVMLWAKFKNRKNKEDGENKTN